MDNLNCNGFKFEEFELLRAGFSDQANILADDELGELFGGYKCKPYCPLDFVSCPQEYCGDYDDGIIEPPID
ncbi:MAG: hypothetical protein K2N79_03275, partial [Muribaculaceae bacterium]|nr:hypothetical protein [Muribaculaceae bacterium]